MTPDQVLMAHVKDVCGSFIVEAVKSTPYPPALLAAITANETGGDATKTRFEAAVFGKLAKVMLSLEAAHPAMYGSIGAQDLYKWVVSPSRKFADSLLSLVNLATSWGPTQIMGYEALAGDFPLSEISNLNTHYSHVVNMLNEFQKRWHISTQIANGPTFANAEAFFRCWNTGGPTGQTADPAYVQNGFNRMSIYENLEAA